MSVQETRAAVRRSTRAGDVRGYDDGRALAFLGIPYAAPPVGAKRFREPEHVEKWDDVRDATAFGPVVPQTPTALIAAATSVEGDDWLTVNVYTPRGTDPGDRLPVLVWVHGGAFLIGSSSEYDGADLAGRGAVVVTVNFRVGIEGFALLEGAPANRGLLDVAAALVWVRDNISSFGGDPGRVTVFGQSAGALMVASLVAMPAAHGLFHRLVVQSPPAVLPTRELAADVTAFIGEGLGLTPTAEGFAAVEPRALADSLTALLPAMPSRAATWGSLAFEITPFGPVIDGEVVTRSPWDALADGAGRDSEILVGHTRDEFRLFRGLGGLPAVSDDQLAQVLHGKSPSGDGGAAYRAAFPEAAADELFETVLSDAAFRMPALHLAQAQVRGGGAAYFYELVWRAPGCGGVFSSCHTLDNSLLLGRRGEGLTAILFGPEVGEDTVAVSTYMQQAWARFAAVGDPGWAPFDGAGRATRVIDVVPTTSTYPEESSRRIWDGHPPLPLELADAGS